MIAYTRPSADVKCAARVVQFEPKLTLAIDWLSVGSYDVDVSSGVTAFTLTEGN